MEVQQEPAVSPPESVLELLELDPKSLVDDLYNAAHCHCADAFDDFDEAIRNDVGTVLSPALQAAAMQGTARLYAAARDSLNRQLERFEAFALETCLAVPAGLLTSVQRHAPADAVDVDPEEEKAVVERLQTLRRQIAEERRAARALQQDIALCDAALEAGRKDEPALQRLAAAVEEKERLTEDVFVISHTGARMQSLLTELQELGRKRESQNPAPTGAVESVLPVMQKVPVKTLQVLKESLTAQ